MTALPYESTVKKSSFMIYRDLYQLGSYSYRAFMRPRSGKAERGTSKRRKSSFPKLPMNESNIVFHSTSSLDFFHPCLPKQRPVVGSMKECQLILSSLI